MRRARPFWAASEQVRGEVLTEGQRLKVYLIEVRRGTRGPQVVVSRTHPGLVKRLFELEVPEIHSGIVEVKSIAREAAIAPRSLLFLTMRTSIRSAHALVPAVRVLPTSPAS